MKGIIIIIIFSVMVGGASAAPWVESHVTPYVPDSCYPLICTTLHLLDGSYGQLPAGAVMWINTSDGSMQEGGAVYWGDLGAIGTYQSDSLMRCGITYTTRIYDSGGGFLTSTSSIRTDADCNQPEVSFAQSVYSCTPTVQINYQYGQNSTIRMHDLSDYGTVLWSATSVNGSGALYPDYNFTPGFSYLVEIQTAEGVGILFDTMDVQLCGTEPDPDDPGGGDGAGEGDGDGDDGTGTGGGGSDGGTDPFTPPNSYDPNVPGQEWKQWIDLNKDGVTSYAESLAAFRFWGFAVFGMSYGLAGFKFGLGVKLW